MSHYLNISSSSDTFLSTPSTDFIFLPLSILDSRSNNTPPYDLYISTRNYTAGSFYAISNLI